MEETLTEFRRAAEEKEGWALSPYAAKSTEHKRFFGPEEDHRLPYKRDVDRIVHSKAYARYVDKTQVVYLVDNDHISHRSLHVQLVSNFARGIAEILRLNLDLVEAIALGHDVGHPPFGHEGEGYLSALSEEAGLGPFSHPWQSCRLFSEIEPLNLGFAVLDGFLSHDGALQERRISPRGDQSWEGYLEHLDRKGREPDFNLSPATLEGCLVKLCDTMSYLGRDLEDAVSLGIISREEIPETSLGRSNREILSRLARDVIGTSIEKPYVALSQEVLEELKALRRFNFERIYTHPKLKVESKKIELSYRILFEHLLEDHRRHLSESYLWKQFAWNKRERYREATEPARLALDFIAGMTDGFFVQTLKRLLIPSPIELA